MPLESRFISRLDGGLVLDITLEDLPFRVYVAQREADVEQVVDLVPPEQFETGGHIHVAAIHDEDDAATQIQEVLFNLDPDDAIVLLCTGPLAYAQVLAELGQGLQMGSD